MRPPPVRRDVSLFRRLAPILTLAAVVVVGGGLVATASSAAAQVPPLVSYGDSQSVLPDEPVAAALSGLPACTGGAAVQEPTFPQALADAGAMFKGPAVQGRKALKAGEYSGTPGRAEVFAAGAAVAGAPEAGLAALLDAAHGAAHDPMLLVDASVFLSELGHPADALAFVDQAQKLGPAKAAPLGLSDTAAELNDRGFALLGMHRYADALKALETAVRAGGRLLSEASINEAQALACTGQREQAFHALVAGAYRQSYDLVEDDETSGTATQEQPPPSQLGFTSPDGPPDVLPTLKYPTSAAEARSAHAGFTALTKYLLDQVSGIQHQESSQSLALYKHLQHVSPLTRQRTNEILALVSEAGPNEPALKQAYDAAATAQDNIDTFGLQFSGQEPKSRCGSHGQWLSLVQTWDTKIRQYVAAVSEYEAPLVAELGNPLAHELALESIRVGDDLELTLLTNTVTNWTAGETGCQQPSTMPAPTDQGAQAGDPGDCPATVPPGHKLLLKIPDLVNITVDCESVEAVVEGEGLVAPFISGEHTFQGETTIFGGAKAGVDLGPLGGELQEGFYVKSGASGVEDWGVRVSASGSATGGPVLIEYGSSVDISLVGSISYIPTAFGFR